MRDQCAIPLIRVFPMFPFALVFHVQFFFPEICAYSDNPGFVIDVLNKCIVIPACFTIRHHKSIGIFLSTDNNPPHKMILECAYSLFL